MPSACFTEIMIPENRKGRNHSLTEFVFSFMRILCDFRIV